MTDPTLTDAQIEAWCEAFHDAYEQAAFDAGWQTQPSSRKPWAYVPEANKETMRRTVAAVVPGMVAAATKAARADERNRARRRRCGCAWCCVTVPVEKRGLAHDGMCKP